MKIKNNNKSCQDKITSKRKELINYFIEYFMFINLIKIIINFQIKKKKN